MLGQWLHNGRLAQVTSVRCRSLVLSGKLIGWIELECIRAGTPERMTLEERFTLEKLDTPDGLLKTVLKHASPQDRRGRMSEIN